MNLSRAGWPKRQTPKSTFCMIPVLWRSRTGKTLMQSVRKLRKKLILGLPGRLQWTQLNMQTSLSSVVQVRLSVKIFHSEKWQTFKSETLAFDPRTLRRESQRSGAPVILLPWGRHPLFPHRYFSTPVLALPEKIIWTFSFVSRTMHTENPEGPFPQNC